MPVWVSNTLILVQVSAINQVVRWYATRADVILLFFDPEKPGTTGETLSILTSALAGFDSKLYIVLNKADQFERIHDFARVYGSLCWNLSKVIHRKDLPPVYSICLPPRYRTDTNSVGVFSSHLESSRDFIIHEIASAPSRRIDNEIFHLLESMVKLQMHCKILNEILRRYSDLVWSARKRTLCSIGAAGCLVGTCLSLNVSKTQVFGASAAAILFLLGFQTWQSKNLSSERAKLIEDDSVAQDQFKSIYANEIAENNEATLAIWPKVREEMKIRVRERDITELSPINSEEFRTIDLILNTKIPSMWKSRTPSVSKSGTALLEHASA
jgi:hypothetical protein